MWSVPKSSALQVLIDLARHRIILFANWIISSPDKGVDEASTGPEWALAACRNVRGGLTDLEAQRISAIENRSKRRLRPLAMKSLKLRGSGAWSASVQRR
jgi:hypothetical protein